MQSTFLVLLGLILLSGCAEKSQAQDKTMRMDYPTFISPSQNVLLQSASLAPFFQQLDQQKATNALRISIIHLGDSHIQQDMMTCVLRKSFQLAYGNAGRGLIVPLKVAKTNEPFDYISSSNIDWKCRKLIQHTRDIPTLGLGGITLQSAFYPSYIDIKVNNRYGINYAFDKVRVFHGQDIPSIKDSLGNEVPFSNGIASFTNPSYRFRIEYNASPTATKAIACYGVSLEKHTAGILYHAVGINGAKFRDYALEPTVIEQLKDLSPNLVIISLGTNEAQKAALTYDACYLQIDSMLQVVKSYHPNTPILLTTPAGSFRNGKNNTTLATVSQAIIAYCSNNNLSYWDLYGISGGEQSAENWRKAGLLGKDGVHFTQKGYEVQGQLLYDAIQNR